MTLGLFVGFLLFFVAGAVRAGYGAAPAECEFGQSFEDALASSQAIFAGKALEERAVSNSTKGGSDIGYSEFRFEVSKSWRLVDKKLVWIRVPAKRADGCGIVASGREYLVFANRLNDLLYVSPLSRTAQTENSYEDLSKLGPTNLIIMDGEFKLFRFDLSIVLSIVIILLLLAIGIRIIYRRSFSAH